MKLWWDSLSVVQQCFALAALPATLLLIIQTVLLLFGFIGGGHDSIGGHDMSDGHDLADGHDFTGGHDVADGHDFAGGHDLPDGHDFSDEHDYADGHHHEGTHGDDGLRIFTIRAFIAFFSIFGWFGIALAEAGVHIIINIIVSTAAGFSAMVLMAVFFKAALKLQSSGNLDMRNALGKTATVYIPIPANRSGKGKVTLIVQERFVEMEAVTDFDKPLKTGTEVVGISISNQNVICVVPKYNQ